MLTAPPLERAGLEASVRRELFSAADPDGAPRLGMEVEVVPIVAATARPCPVEPEPGEGGPALGAILGGWARESGGRAVTSRSGLPAYAMPGGGTVSFEPGGQVEYSSGPRTSLPGLLEELREFMEPLARRALDEGVRLLARGMDPCTKLADTRLQAAGERYRRMDAHYGRAGAAGRRMMRQTAALHLNVDLGRKPTERWAVANALVPCLTALFANSPRSEGRPTGHRSSRALQWRTLDPSRTGVQGAEADPAAAYLRFALEADAFLLGPPDRPARAFREWLVDGASAADWRRHLTTLFPEVRPRGYLELRCFDALPLRWYAAPAAVVCGILYDDDALSAALECLPPADAGALEVAGRSGLADPALRARCATVLDLAGEGLRRLPELGGPAVVGLLEDFRRSCPDRGLDPGHAPGDDLLS